MRPAARTPPVRKERPAASPESGGDPNRDADNGRDDEAGSAGPDDDDAVGGAGVGADADALAVRPSFRREERT